MSLLSVHPKFCWLIMPCALLLLATAAVAQPSGGSRGRASGRSAQPSQPRSVELEAIVRPTFIGSDLEIIRTEVQLDEGQAIIVETLLADFEQAFSEGVQLLRVDLQQARPGATSGSSLEGMQQGQSAYDEQLRVLRESFSAQLRGATTFEQREKIREEFTAAMERLTRERTAIESLTGEEEDWGQFLSVQAELLQEWLAERRVLESDFVIGVELMLEEPQLEAWLSAQRSIRRRDIPAIAVFGGEGLDLSARVRLLELERESVSILEPVLQQYALSIDEALLTRNTFLIEAVPVLSKTLAEGNWPRMQSIIRDEATVRARFRDMNLQWFEHIVDALPEPHRTLFRDDVRRDAFGSTWSPSRIDRMLDAAVQLQGLAADELQQLQSVGVSCVNEDLRKQMEAARRVEAPMAWIQQQELRWSKSFDGANVAARGKSDAMRTVEKLQLEQDAKCMDMIKSILGDERYGQLPGARTQPRGSGASSRRSEESNKRREELYGRFDANGDGRLDSEERKVMREAMQNERRRP